MAKVSLGGYLHPLINKVKKNLNQVPFLLSIHLMCPFYYTLFMSWINQTLKLEWCKTCSMVRVGVINLCKTISMPSIFYDNSLKPNSEKYHKYFCKYFCFCKCCFDPSPERTEAAYGFRWVINNLSWPLSTHFFVECMPLHILKHNVRDLNKLDIQKNPVLTWRWMF